VLPERVLGRALVLDLEAHLRTAARARHRDIEDIVPGAVHRQLLGDVAGDVLIGGLDLGVGGRLALDGLSLPILRPGTAPRFLFLVDLQHHVRIQGLLDLGIELGRRQLQEADRLLQLRRHHQALS
jgi:hypothetical protein